MEQLPSNKLYWGKRDAFFLPLLYLGACIFWIAASDYLFWYIAPDLNKYVLFQVAKGVLFVCVTAGFLFLLIRKYLRILHETNRHALEMHDTLHALIQAHPGVIYRCKFNEFWSMQYISDNCRDLTGYSPEELIDDRATTFRDIIHPDDREWVKEKVHAAIALGKPFEVTYRLVTSQDEIRWVWEKGMLRKRLNLEGDCLEGFIFDYSEIKRSEEERLKLENQLHQTQHVEAIGRLAGSIAHDFNNILTVISGYCSIMVKLPQTSGRMNALLHEIKLASEKGAKLVRQLLAVGRSQTLEPKVMNINDLIIGLKPMIQSLAQDTIQVEYRLAERLRAVRIDPNQLEQATINLLINARDSIHRDGRIVIETSEQVADQAFVSAHPDANPGEYICLSVRDSGCGISPEIQEKIFEPFFTTKKNQGGSGLGLPMVYGFIKQSGGFMWLESEVGQGTAFHLGLPVAEETVTLDLLQARKSPDNQMERKREHRSNGACVLVVEDETPIRLLVSRILESAGYTVCMASNGEEALDRMNDCRSSLKLLITDIRMPGMNGGELAQRVQEVAPEIKVIFMSGYIDDAVVDDGIRNGLYTFIEKPFSPKALLSLTQTVLGESIPSNS